MMKPLHIHTRAQNHPDKQKSRYMSRIGGCSPNYGSLLPVTRVFVTISDITLPGGRESKISQYADDNTCFVTNDYGILKVLDAFLNSMDV
jgi:hypothetical protein